MTAKSPTQIRLGLAEGHWELGEHDEALACLDRIDEPCPEARSLLEALLEVERDEGVRDRLTQALAPHDAPSPVLATPTMAALLEEQGHGEKARQVAQDALMRNPEDARAQAVLRRLDGDAGLDARIATLERWLEYFRSQRQGEARS